MASAGSPAGEACVGRKQHTAEGADEQLGNARRSGAKTLQAIPMRAAPGATFPLWLSRSCLDCCMVVFLLQLRVVWVVGVRVDAAVKELAQARAQQHGRDGHGAHRLNKGRAAASVGGLGLVTRGYEPALS